MKTFAALLMGLIGSATAFAADRTETIKQIMETQGLVAAFEQQIASSREYSEKLADEMLSQILKGLDPPEKLTTGLRDAATTFVKEAQNPITAEQIVAMWSDSYGKQFTDQELTQLLKHYKTPLAQKELTASRQAMSEMTTKLQTDYKPIMEKATAHFIETAQQIIRDCNCKKK